MNESFKAFVVDKTESDFTVNIKELTLQELALK